MQLLVVKKIFLLNAMSPEPSDAEIPLNQEVRGQIQLESSNTEIRFLANAYFINVCINVFSTPWV